MKKFLPYILLCIVISASLFMVFESGEYYSTFYENNYQGYWAALLVEGFLVIASMLFFSGNRLLNLTIKIVMIPLFAVVVIGATLKVVEPLMSELAEVKAKGKLVDFLETDYKNSATNLTLLKGQKTNTALAIIHQRQVSNELLSELNKSPKASWMIWVVICFSTFLRFSVQLANMLFAHVLGLMWIKNKTQTAKTISAATKKSGRLIKHQNSGRLIKHQNIFQFIKRNGGSVTRSQILISRILKGGVKEYDRILKGLERAGKIKVDREKESKQGWVYSVV